MRKRILRPVCAARATGGYASMDSLESRTLFAADPLIVHVGPNQEIKTLTNYQALNKINQPVKILVDYSDTPYDLPRMVVTGDVTVLPSDPSHRPTLRLSSAFKPKSKGSDTLMVDSPSVRITGHFTIKGFDTIGGENAILLGSSKNAVIDCEDMHMLDGGAIWRGDGADSVYFKDNEIHGTARANVYSSFTYTVHKCVIDNSGTDVPIQQGGHIIKGNPIGETAIRIMNVDDMTMIHVKTLPWFYKPGKEWKQDVQLRPSSKHITLIGCSFYQPDIGDMTWRKPAHPIDRVDFIDCTMVKMPSIQAGVTKVTFSNCTIGGKVVNK